MCQVAVTLTCASPAGHALIGRALYLPAAWAADEGRRELAGVPDEVMFATKPQLVGGLLRHARDRGIRAGFTVGDEVYGGLDLRKSIRERGTGYVMGVRSSCRVTLPSGRHLTAKDASLLVKPGMWQRMRTGSATKGARDYHWAMIKITPDDTPGGQDRGHAVLLLRRHRYTGTVSSYLCRTANPVPLARLIKVAVTRWRIEIAFLHLKATVRGSRRPLRGHSPELARQEAWALLLIHNIVATAAARAAAEAGTSPGLIPFAPVLALVRAHIAADVPCPHCGHRPSTAEDQLSDLNAAILACPATAPDASERSDAPPPSDAPGEPRKSPTPSRSRSRISRNGTQPRKLKGSALAPHPKGPTRPRYKSQTGYI